MRYLFIIGILLFSSCAKNAQQNISDAIESANIFLTDSQCDEALKELDNIGYQPKNTRYIIALAASYACKAGYKTTIFILVLLESI